jgi:hypothetical protein
MRDLMFFHPIPVIFVFRNGFGKTPKTLAMLNADACKAFIIREKIPEAIRYSILDIAKEK